MTNGHDNKAETPPDVLSGSAITPEQFERFLEYIASGKSINVACSHEGMPSTAAIKRLIRNSPDDTIRSRYAQARVDQAHALADETIDIADTEDDPQRAKVRIDARKWYAGKLHPRIYGDSLRVDGTTEVTVLRPDEVAARVAQLQQERAALERGGR